MAQPGATYRPAADAVGAPPPLVAEEPPGGPGRPGLGVFAGGRQPRPGQHRLEPGDPRPRGPVPSCRRSAVPRRDPGPGADSPGRAARRIPTQGRRFEAEKILRETQKPLRDIPESAEKEQLLLELRSTYAATLGVADLVSNSRDRLHLPFVFYQSWRLPCIPTGSRWPSELTWDRFTGSVVTSRTYPRTSIPGCPGLAWHTAQMVATWRSLPRRGALSSGTARSLGRWPHGGHANQQPSWPWAFRVRVSGPARSPASSSRWTCLHSGLGCSGRSPGSRQESRRLHSAVMPIASRSGTALVASSSPGSRGNGSAHGRRTGSTNLCPRLVAR